MSSSRCLFGLMGVLALGCTTTLVTIAPPNDAGAPTDAAPTPPGDDGSAVAPADAGGGLDPDGAIDVKETQFEAGAADADAAAEIEASPPSCPGTRPTGAPSQACRAYTWSQGTCPACAPNAYACGTGYPAELDPEAGVTEAMPIVGNVFCAPTAACVRASEYDGRCAAGTARSCAPDAAIPVSCSDGGATLPPEMPVVCCP